MARSLWKGPYIDSYLVKKLKKVNKKSWSMKISSRRSIIVPQWINKKIEIHTGNKWISTTVQNEKIGFHFGEFATSKKIAKYRKKTK